MTHRSVVVASVLAGMLAAVAFWWSAAPPVADPADNAAEGPREASADVRAPDAPRVDGSTEADAPEPPRESRPRLVGEAARPADWDGVRSQADRAWEEASLEAAASFAAERGYSSDQSEAVRLALVAFHEELAGLRRAIRSGSVSPLDGRPSMESLRDTARSDIVAAIGETETNLLRERLSQNRGGGF